MTSLIKDAVKSRKYQQQIVSHWTKRCKELLQERNNLSRDDLEYVALCMHGNNDDRLKECIATLIGWGDEDRAELETFIAISLELMKTASPSRLREAASMVEFRYHAKWLGKS